jgi:antirestriction protein ArdC
MSDEPRITTTTSASTATTPSATFGSEPPGPVPAPAPRKRGSFPTRPSSAADASGGDERRSVYEIVTARILELLERGTVPWRAGWTTSGVGVPRSAITGKAYRGINFFLLSVAAQVAGYRNGSWITFRQAKEVGGSIRRGEKGSLCIFWRVLDGAGERSPNDGDVASVDVSDQPTAGGRRRRFVLRYYTVFNIEQCEGLPTQFDPNPDVEPQRRIVPCDDIVLGFGGGPRIEHGFNAAWYTPDADLVSMPAPVAFRSPEDYYATLFHELTHATGHPDRLARFSKADALVAFGSSDYSREELVAEMGSALLCAEGGISSATIENQAAYIGGWVAALRGDARAVIVAAAQAQRAADLILGRTTGPA